MILYEDFRGMDSEITCCTSTVLQFLQNTTKELSVNIYLWDRHPVRDRRLHAIPVAIVLQMAH